MCNFYVILILIGGINTTDQWRVTSPVFLTVSINNDLHHLHASWYTWQSRYLSGESDNKQSLEILINY